MCWVRALGAQRLLCPTDGRGQPPPQHGLGLQTSPPNSALGSGHGPARHTPPARSLRLRQLQTKARPRRSPAPPAPPRPADRTPRGTARTLPTSLAGDRARTSAPTAGGGSGSCGWRDPQRANGSDAQGQAEPSQAEPAPLRQAPTAGRNRAGCRGSALAARAPQPCRDRRQQRPRAAGAARLGSARPLTPSRPRAARPLRAASRPARPCGRKLRHACPPAPAT